MILNLKDVVYNVEYFYPCGKRCAKAVIAGGTVPSSITRGTAILVCV